MQLTQEFMPEFSIAMAVIRHTTAAEEAVNRKKQRDEQLKATAGVIQGIITTHTDKIRKVIENICKKKRILFTFETADSQISEKIWERKIGINTFDRKLCKPIARITVDCTTPRINIKVGKDAECPKIFTTRINAAIKKATRRSGKLDDFRH